MILKFMEIEMKFQNKESEITKIFDMVNKNIEKNNVFLKSLVIDEIEIYEDYYEYFLENIDVIDEVEVKVQSLKELIDDILYSGFDYIMKAIPKVETLSKTFKRVPTEEAWNDLDDLFVGIGWVLDSYKNIDNHSNLNEIISDYYIWNEYVVEIKKLKDLLPEFLEAIENKDTILIGDILAYEINPVFKSMVEKLKKIAKEDVSIENAN